MSGLDKLQKINDKGELDESTSIETLLDLKEYIAQSLFEQRLTNRYLSIIYGEDLREDEELKWAD